MTPEAQPSRRSRVLVLAESLPWPSAKGGDLRTWQNVNALAAVAEVGVFGLCSNDTRRTWPRDLPLAFWTTSSDPALTSPPPKHLRLAARAWLLDPQGHPSDLFHSAGAADELARVVRDFRPDCVLVEGVWLHGYLSALRAAGTRVILDCFNVESALYRELAATTPHTGLEGRVIRDVLPARTETIERAAVGSVDQVWVCSDEDERRLRAAYAPARPVVVIPNGLPIGTEAGRSATGAGCTEASRSSLTVVFPALFSYFPNALAAEFLIEQLLPRLAAAAAPVPCRIVLAGGMPTEVMCDAARRDPRVVVTGAVKEMSPHLNAASVMAVPLFHGGGTRLKILEAFASGLPVVSSAKGAEGLGAEHRRHLLIADTPEEFVDAILEVWRDPILAGRLVACARTLVVEGLSWAVIAPRVHRAFEQLLAARSVG